MNAVMTLLKEFPSLLAFHGKNHANQAEGFAFSQLESGLPKGALVEISGSAGNGKTEAVLRFLAENPTVRVAWVEEEFTVYPCAFPQSRVGLDRVLFVDSTPGETLWTVHQILRSQVFGVIVLQMKAAAKGERGEKDEMALRRLQLAAEKAQVTIILLSEEPAKKGTWPISVQLQVNRSAPTTTAFETRALNLNVLKYKGQRSWQVTIG
jgi:hypothetical protein